MLIFQFYTPNQAAYLIRQKKKKKVKLGHAIRLHNFNNFRTFENLASKYFCL